MRHTSGSLPFKLHTQKRKKRGGGGVERERQRGREGERKHFKSNFPKEKRMVICITTKFNFFSDFSSCLIACIGAMVGKKSVCV